MKKVVVASQNPVKLAAIQQGFLKMFPEESFTWVTESVPSGVGDQPLSDEETLQGAINRVENIRKLVPEADYWTGIEGGVEFNQTGEMCAYAWVVICSIDQFGKARTGAFFLPPKVALLVKEGKELGDADDIVFGEHNSKQKNGAVGLLTNNLLDRTGFYVQAVVLALIPFLNNELYSQY